MTRRPMRWLRWIVPSLVGLGLLAAWRQYLLARDPAFIDGVPHISFRGSRGRLTANIPTGAYTPSISVDEPVDGVGDLAAALTQLRDRHLPRGSRLVDIEIGKSYNYRANPRRVPGLAVVLTSPDGKRWPTRFTPDPKHYGAGVTGDLVVWESGRHTEGTLTYREASYATKTIEFSIRVPEIPGVSFLRSGETLPDERAPRR